MIARRASRILLVAMALLVLTGCRREHESIFATAPSVPTPTPLSSFVNGLLVFPQALVGGGAVTFTVTTTIPAPPGGLRVDLAASSSAVTIPASVTVPAGSVSVQFSGATAAVSSDVDVVVSATGAGATNRASVAVYSAKTPSLVWAMEPDPQLRLAGLSGQSAAPGVQFSGSCIGNGVRLMLSDGWSLIFGPGAGKVLEPGTYENASFSSRPGSPLLDVSRPGFPCSVAGRFVVHDVAVSKDNRTVRRLWATVDGTCPSGASPRVALQIRYSDGSPDVSGACR